jgi:hypothetical protein
MDNGDSSSFSIMSSFSPPRQHSSFSISPETKKAAANKRKRKRMINPSLTYAEYNFLKDLAKGKVDGTDNKYSRIYKNVLKHRLRRKFSVVMEMAEMMRKVREENKI